MRTFFANTRPCFGAARALHDAPRVPERSKLVANIPYEIELGFVRQPAALRDELHETLKQRPMLLEDSLASSLPRRPVRPSIARREKSLSSACVTKHVEDARRRGNGWDIEDCLDPDA